MYVWRRGIALRLPTSPSDKENPLNPHPLVLEMVWTKLAPTASVARRWIVEGCVLVNGEKVTSIDLEIHAHDTVEVIR